MDRRQFLSAATASLASQVAFAQDKPRRVGLIGCGWYGKADLFRLVQVAPVNLKQETGRAAQATFTIPLRNRDGY